jgi:hypothetical protein
LDRKRHTQFPFKSQHLAQANVLRPHTTWCRAEASCFRSGEISGFPKQGVQRHLSLCPSVLGLEVRLHRIQAPQLQSCGGSPLPAQPGCAEHRARGARARALLSPRNHRPNLFREGVWGEACAIPRGGRARASLLSARASEGCRHHPQHPRRGDARASHAAPAPLKPPRVSGKPKKCFERVWEVLVR